MAARAFLSSRLARLVAARNCGGRTYAAAAEAAVSKEPVSVAAVKARLPAAEKAPMNEEWSWMRDPKTGCWMPENHIDDVDAADLRARLIFSKNQ